MRIVILHNRYRHEGGEERAVADLTALLGRRGHDVHLIQRHSAAATRGQAARSMIAGGSDVGEIRDVMAGVRPDVVHAHNVHPLIGWRALAEGRAVGACTVLHLHNFRLFCAIGVASREGAPCFRCRGRDTRPGLRLRCRGSLAESVVYAAGLYLQQPRLLEQAERLVTVSEAQANRLFQLGLPRGAVYTLPNFVFATRLAKKTRAAQGRHALVTGRLVKEKGFDTAIAASREVGVPLVVAGDGPDRARLEGLADGARVRFTGFVTQAELASLRADAAVVLVPSRSEEAFPYAALDALADGVPVLASDYGGLPELVGDDAALPPDDRDAWNSALAQLWLSPTLRTKRGDAALERVRSKFTEDSYYDGLMRIYRN